VVAFFGFLVFGFWFLASWRFCVPFKVSIWLRPDESAIAPATQRLRRRLACGEGKYGAHDRYAGRIVSVTKNSKYVNMTDINLTGLPSRAASAAARPKDEPAFDLIELLFFAYRDFVGDADEMLAQFGFGRAHHRVLHFVNRNPGMKVAELLDILKITKQSLGRVLKQLIDEGYVVQKEGAKDRRHRLLSVTDKGEALALRLAALQSLRLGRALADLGPHGQAMARRFLIGVLDPKSRDGVLRLIEDAERAQRRRP
jgi:DNA-binding MarR family transcriptional regulator